jgi:hypothetical protein
LTSLAPARQQLFDQLAHAQRLVVGRDALDHGDRATAMRDDDGLVGVLNAGEDGGGILAQVGDGDDVGDLHIGLTWGFVVSGQTYV